MTKESIRPSDDKTQISFSIRLVDRMYFVAVDTIAFICLEGKTVYLVDFNGKKHVIGRTLESLESAVSAQQFHRINRQMIVNRQAIRDVETYTNQRVLVHLTVPTPEKVIIPRLKIRAFLTWIEKG